MNTLSKTIRAGIRSLGRHKRLLIPLYILNLLSALVVILPVTNAFNEFIGTNNIVRERLESAFDIGVFVEFADKNSAALGASGNNALISGIVYTLLTLFFSAGILYCFHHKPKTILASFFSASVTYAWRVARLALMCLPVFGIFYCLGFLADLGLYIIAGDDPYQNQLFAFGIAKIGLSFYGMLLAGLVFDYARIDMVLRNEHKVRKSFGRSLKFVLFNFFSTNAIALTLVVVSTAIMFAIHGGINLYAASNPVAIVLFIIIQQLYILFQIAIRMVTFGSHMELYKRRTYR